MTNCIFLEELKHMHVLCKDIPMEDAATTRAPEPTEPLLLPLAIAEPQMRSEDILLQLALGSFLRDSQSPLRSLGVDLLSKCIGEAVQDNLLEESRKLGLLTPPATPEKRKAREAPGAPLRQRKRAMIRPQARRELVWNLSV